MRIYSISNIVNTDRIEKQAIIAFNDLQNIHRNLKIQQNEHRVFWKRYHFLFHQWLQFD
jgi:hypothetical protein